MSDSELGVEAHALTSLLLTNSWSDLKSFAGGISRPVAIMRDMALIVGAL